MDPAGLCLFVNLKRVGCIWMQVRGRCMEPLILAGDEVRIVSGATLTEGFLYCIALPNDQVAVHRYIGSFGGANLFKGDRSGRFDVLNEPVVLGRADAIVVGGGSRAHRLGRCPKMLLAKPKMKVADETPVCWVAPVFAERAKRLILALVDAASRDVWRLLELFGTLTERWEGVFR